MDARPVGCERDCAVVRHPSALDTRRPSVAEAPTPPGRMPIYVSGRLIAPGGASATQTPTAGSPVRRSRQKPDTPAFLDVPNGSAGPVPAASSVGQTASRRRAGIPEGGDADRRAEAWDRDVGLPDEHRRSSEMLSSPELLALPPPRGSVGRDEAASDPPSRSASREVEVLPTEHRTAERSSRATNRRDASKHVKRSIVDGARREITRSEDDVGRPRRCARSSSTGTLPSRYGSWNHRPDDVAGRRSSDASAGELTRNLEIPNLAEDLGFS